MTITKLMCVGFCWWGLLSPHICSACVDFVFPTADIDTAVDVTENTPFIFHFQVVNVSCSGEVTVTVRNTATETNTQVICRFRIRNGQYVTNAGHSVCNATSNNALTWTFARSDAGHWTWSAEDFNRTQITLKNVTFNVLYPPRVTGLWVEPSHPADPGGTVTVRCTWEQGNPPVNASIMSKGHEMGTSGSNGPFQVVIVNVTCDDMGSITCEAPGGEQNETGTLLVKCPPVFPSNTSDQHVIRGSSGELQFPVRAYSVNFTHCLLIRTTSPRSNGEHLEPANDTNAQQNCSSSLTVTGTPPDLTVSVRLDNVNTQDQGTWRLTLTNDAGDGHVSFYLSIIKHTTSLATATVITAIAVTLLLTYGIVCVTIICVKKGSGRGRQQVVRQAAPPGADHRASADANAYVHVPDDAVNNIELVAVRPTRHCHAPHQAPLSEVYLHPSPSLLERTNTPHGMSTSSHIGRYSH